MPSTFIKKQVVRAGRKYHVAPRVLMGLIEQESGFNPGAVSSAGARGLTQFIPSTARAYGVKYGTSKKAQKTQIRGAAHYLSDLGFQKNKRQALGNYYGSTSAPYAGEVLAKSKKYKGLNKSIGGGGGKNVSGGAGGGKKSKLKQMPGKTATIPGVSYKAERQAAALSLIRDKDRTWEDYANFKDTMQQYKDIPKKNVSIPGTYKRQQQKKQQQKGQAKAGKSGGNVTLAPGADRAGVHTKKSVINFAKKVSAISGKHITIGTGTNHSRMTTSGNVSDHWTGHAGDIPATGKKLTRLGRAALIAAGMSKAKARKVNGGLFNIGGHQIIFNTNIGGNHYNHLHISA